MDAKTLDTDGAGAMDAGDLQRHMQRKSSHLPRALGGAKMLQVVRYPSRQNYFYNQWFSDAKLFYFSIKTGTLDQHVTFQ